MFYYLFDFLDKQFDFPGAGVFQYISFRAAMALIGSLLISLVFGKRIIGMLHRKQVGETIRELGLQGQMEKKGTPTMGGLIILSAILIPTLLFAKLHNVYMFLMMLYTVWLGAIGFLDDYIKVFKKNKEGLAGRFKVLGQIGIGLIVGITLYFNDAVVVKEKVLSGKFPTMEMNSGPVQAPLNAVYSDQETKSMKTTIPFVKNNEFDYSSILSFLGDGYEKWAWLIFIPIVILIVTAVSNGANITDGIDGLATGTSAIIGVVLGILAYEIGRASCRERV